MRRALLYLGRTAVNGSPRPLFRDALGDSRVDSDLALLLESQPDIPLSTLSALKDAFAESWPPFKVDVVRRSDLSPEFYQAM